MALNAAQLGTLSRLLDQALPLELPARQAWLDSLPSEHAQLLPALHRMLLGGPRDAAGPGPLSTLDLAPQIWARGALGPENGMLQAGQRVGPYELMREIGSGGMAVVWLARRVDGAFKRELALKLPAVLHVRPDLAQRFARERDILASLEHPHIARMYDAGVTADGLPYLAMEYVEGRTLETWCDENQLEIRARLQVFLQILEAVRYAHGRNVVHRDLKPANILVSLSGHARLLDFGVAHLIDPTAGDDVDGPTLTAQFGPLLTLAYASPEQMLGEHCSAASDVYALGVVLYELLTGSRPYRVSGYASLVQLARALQTNPITQPSANVGRQAASTRGATNEDLRRLLFGALDTITLKALAGPVPQRYATAAEFAADIQAFLSGQQARNARQPMPAGPRRTNLPAAVEALIGRDDDARALLDLVRQHRLLTLQGPGGAGKTRLAAAVAHRLVADFAHGVWWVDLAAQSSGEHLAGAIAGAANLQLGSGDPNESLLQALSTREALLVLDNCEHLVDAVAALASRIVDAAPQVRLLATSQVALKTAAEQLYLLDGLAVPAAVVDADAALRYGALRLLERRVQAADRHFRLSAGNVAEAVRLCGCLDGMPLAIEMAAARVARLGLGNVVARLDERLQLLRAAGRGAPERQHTMRAVLDWSHALLEPVERTVLRRLGVFVGNFRLESAQAVACGDDLHAWDVVDALGALVDKSLVQKRPGEPTRYRLLETTRLYALEGLGAAGEVDSARIRHADAMCRLAEQMERDRSTMAETPWLHACVADYHDLDSAFEFAAAMGQAEVVARVGDVLRTVDSLLDVRPKTDHRAEVAYRLTRALGDSAPPRLWNVFLGTLQLRRWAEQTPVALAEEALRAGQRHGAADIEQLAHLRLAIEYGMLGDFASSKAHLVQAKALEDQACPAVYRLRRLTFVTLCAQFEGDIEMVRESSQQLIRLADATGASRMAAWAKITLSDAALMAADYTQAIAICRSAVAQFEALDQPRSLSLALLNLISAQLFVGDQAAARSAAGQLLQVLDLGIDWGYEGLALLLARDGEFECSAQIIGYLKAWYPAHQRPVEPTVDALGQMATQLCASALGNDEYDRLRAAGATLTTAQIRERIRGLLRAAATG